jgi:hypothetical protein
VTCEVERTQETIKANNSYTQPYGNQTLLPANYPVNAATASLRRLWRIWTHTQEIPSIRRIGVAVELIPQSHVKDPKRRAAELRT